MILTRHARLFCIAILVLSAGAWYSFAMGSLNENLPTYVSIPDLRGERSEEHTSELQSRTNLVCRLLLEKKKTNE